MDWTNTAHLLQALLCVAGVFAFFHGYKAGDSV